MPNAAKVERVAELKARIEGADALLLTEYRGLTVSEITELRRSLARGRREPLGDQEHPDVARCQPTPASTELDELLAGPSAVAFIQGDVVAVAKKLKDASKLYPALVIKGGYMDGWCSTPPARARLAELESREVMLSKIAGLLKGEMSRAAAAFILARSRSSCRCWRLTKRSFRPAMRRRRRPNQWLRQRQRKQPASRGRHRQRKPAARGAEGSAEPEASAEEAPVEEAAATSTEGE